MRCRPSLARKLVEASFLTIALLGSTGGTQTKPDAHMLAPIRAWIDAYNSARTLPENIFTSDVLVTDEFAPYVWSGAAGEHRWAQAIDTFMKPGQQHVSVGEPQDFISQGDRVSFALPATLTISVAPHPPRTEHALWKFDLTRSQGQWLIAADMWIGDAASGAAVTVPMRNVHGILLIQGMLDDEGPYWFMVDPGGADTYSSFARGNGQPPKDLCVAGRCVQPKFTLVDDFSAGRDVGGSIGPSIFQEYVVRIDYLDSMVTLIPPREFHPASNVEELPLTVDPYGMPVIPANVNGIAGSFQLDIRARSSLLFQPFVARSGVDRVQRLNLGKVELKDPPFKISSMKIGKFADPVEAGLLGNNVLSSFIVTVDESHQRVFISQ